MQCRWTVSKTLADNIVLIFKEEGKAQVFLEELTKVIPSFGMNFAPIQCKVMLVDMRSLNTPLTIQGEVLKVVEHFTCLGSCISSDCSVTDEVNARICKARAAFANLRHLWRQSDLSLNLKGRVYQAAVWAILLCGSELRRLHVIDNRCLRTIARVGWCPRIHNEAVRKRVFGCATGTSIEEYVQHQKLCWLRTCVTYAEPSFAEESAVFHAQFRLPVKSQIWSTESDAVTPFLDRTTKNKIVQL
ncbi:hypothetical protein T265_05340 [Opisthorchis viverrini]|uniref:Uncharacterized protein n=1 Tax=Opisthorchis viverrini TaxID=6198 RepID=A0A074ZKQ5_OPIVI|nr:hypothetical protein T265_05340 [Opisthorchis viverrini]KER27616.1 hypothetical protein T265_05340 [Opisthorchis viverrini]